MVGPSMSCDLCHTTICRGGLWCHHRYCRRSAKSTLRGIRFESLYKKPPYNTVSDFTPVSRVVEAPRTLITPKTFPSDGMDPSEQAEQRTGISGTSRSIQYRRLQKRRHAARSATTASSRG